MEVDYLTSEHLIGFESYKVSVIIMRSGIVFLSSDFNEKEYLLPNHVFVVSFMVPIF